MQEQDHKTNLVDQRKVNGQLTVTNAVVELNLSMMLLLKEVRSEVGFGFVMSWFMYFIEHVK